MVEIATVVALTIQMTAPYIVWFSRFNVPTHVALGFCVAAYIFPGLFTQIWANYSPSVVDVYAKINILGATFIVFGTVIGALLARKVPRRSPIMNLFGGGIDSVLYKRVITVAGLGAAGLTLAYILMGFVPMFAADPLSAKQFKGDYRESYYKVAYLFRFSFAVVSATIPLLLAVWWGKSSRFALILGIFCAALIAISLARASTLQGVIVFLGIIAAFQKKWFFLYMILVLLIFPAGSAGYLLIGSLLGVDSLTSIYSLDSIADVIASGAPDIADQLQFLSDFYGREQFTYGRTFIGGLVPGNYEWNPSVWTLTHDDFGADISEVVSGGLRLSVALWGYASFGWTGVIAVPFVSGVISGYIYKKMKSLPLSESVVACAAAIVLLMTAGKQFVEFYFLSIHNLPGIVIAIYFCYFYRKSKLGNRI